MARRALGVALDIDGVLLLEDSVIPGATRALEMLRDQKIPHVFMTNGGGTLEENKASQLQVARGASIAEPGAFVAHAIPVACARV